jgi:regulatory protein
VPSQRAEQLAARRGRRAEITDPAVVMEAAAAFLAVRPRSVAETRRRLRHLGYGPEVIETVLTRFVELAYLDDEAFARAWVESRDRARPRGEGALRRELALKGIDRELVVRLLEERREAGVDVGETSDGTQPASPDEVAARRLLERRLSALLREADPRRRRQKAYALLARNGFDPEVCRTVSASLPDESSDD